MSTRRHRRHVRIDEKMLRENVRLNRSGARGWSAEVLARAGAASATVGMRVLAFALTIAAAVAVALPLVYLAGGDGTVALDALVSGSWGTPLAAAETLVQAVPLLIAGLAVAVAFHAGLFNIGVEGQLVAGALAAGTVGATLPLPGPVLMVVCVLAGAMGGALWALVPALLKAYRGVHEVVSTIMMNYIAFALSTFLVSPGGPFVSTTQPSATEKIPLDARLPILLPGTRLHAGLILAVILAIAVGWYLYRTPAGYAHRLTGANPLAAREAGLSVARVTLRAMLFSGALAGLAGTVQVVGLFGRYFDAFSPGYGFDAIAVALLGALSPWGIAAAALFFGTLDSSAVYLQAQAGVSREMVGVVSGLVVGFVAAQPAILRLARRRRTRGRNGPGRGGPISASETGAPVEASTASRDLADELAGKGAGR